MRQTPSKLGDSKPSIGPVRSGTRSTGKATPASRSSFEASTGHPGSSHKSNSDCSGAANSASCPGGVLGWALFSTPGAGSSSVMRLRTGLAIGPKLISPSRFNPTARREGPTALRGSANHCASAVCLELRSTRLERRASTAARTMAPWTGRNSASRPERWQRCASSQWVGTKLSGERQKGQALSCSSRRSGVPHSKQYCFAR